MKRILCHFAQRCSRPTGLFVNHVSGCRKCEEFFRKASSLESRLVIDAGDPDLDLCATILAGISVAPEPAAVIQPDRAWVWSRGGLIAAAAAVVLMIGILSVIPFNQPDLVLDDPVEEVATPPVALPQAPRELTLAYAMQQQELLQRDALKLGTHLRENLILFQRGDQ
ncbi:hypothetical protein V2O64_02045 [Verrucomicrobiaceae bacterium 227]